MSEETGTGLSRPESQPTEPVDILLVEDNAGDVRLTREAFKTGAIETRIHVVRDGVEALEYLYKRGEYEDAACPALVLLDLNLPRMNGDAVLAEIRNAPELRRVPVIVLSSSEDEADVERSYELQANAYITKPVAPGEFTEMIDAFESFWLSTARLPPANCES